MIAKDIPKPLRIRVRHYMETLYPPTYCSVLRIAVAPIASIYEFIMLVVQYSLMLFTIL